MRSFVPCHTMSRECRAKTLSMSRARDWGCKGGSCLEDLVYFESLNWVFNMALWCYNHCLLLSHVGAPWRFLQKATWCARHSSAEGGVGVLLPPGAVMAFPHFTASQSSFGLLYQALQERIKAVKAGASIRLWWLPLRLLRNWFWDPLIHDSLRASSYFSNIKHGCSLPKLAELSPICRCCLFRSVCLPLCFSRWIAFGCCCLFFKALLIAWRVGNSDCFSPDSWRL